MNNDTIKAAEEYVGAKTATSDQVIKRQSEIIKQKDDQINELVDWVISLKETVEECDNEFNNPVLNELIQKHKR